MVAHLWANLSNDYPPDGFSFPYQFMISFGSLLFAFLGLYFLRSILLLYFSDNIVSISLLALVLGSNYLNYTAIDGALTHNNLFTIYVLLIYTSIQFYKRSNISKAIIIGALIGISALTRPTEIIAFIIPFAWGINLFSVKDLHTRVQFLINKHLLLIIMIFMCFSIGSIQLIYWKYVSGNWLVYSYQDQGFSWLHPHIKDGLFSYKGGWLTYSPLMIFSLIGFYPLYKTKQTIFSTSIVFICLFMYIAFSWDIWWYGGSLGQRSMIQAYPILLFPLSSFIEYISKQKKWLKMSILFIGILFCYINIWFTHQAHEGGLFHAGHMTRSYYWKTLGRFDDNIENLKLLDTDEYYYGTRKNIQVIYKNDFEKLKGKHYQIIDDSSNTVLYLDANNQQSEAFSFNTNTNNDFDWIRAQADFKINEKEWNFWTMTQFVISFYSGNNIIKERSIRLQRLLWGGAKKTIFIDVKKPNKPFDKIRVHFWNGNGNKKILIDNLNVETFNSN